ncbi:Synaptic vesicle transporter SVOP and related transporters (major facilitator superfamily) [Phaffia rhodozyma]|uniref:Synaptic vesicle transporter SVOP and related transporters (Major facilitator superfamily) n=1 Tax=Phaffia rhodozyma TaxID=264483 RepID=A0A0F7SF31_PHARH|nr:Synaptic vesicle transporter SVOP and related transporters (major facilitator superfamily) [Phaffia rhodozyma]
MANEKKPSDDVKRGGLNDEQVEELEREGKIIVVHFEDGDEENPMNWPKSKKWITTILLCAMTLFIGLATSAYSVGISSMCEEFGVDSEVGQVGMFVFNAAFSVVPLFFAPLSETIGRNPVYLVNYALFTVFFIPLALGKNIWTIIIARFFSGIFGAAGTTLIGGGLSDIWVTSERSAPMALFSFAAVLGTILAPLYSGYILLYKGWRWIQWVQLIVNGVVCLIEFAFCRETRGAVILTKRAKKLRKDTGDERYRSPVELERDSYKDVLKDSCTKAVKLLVHEPTVIFFSFYLAFSWSMIFLFFTVIPLTFEGNHGWKTGNSGLAYLGLVVGTCLGYATNFWQDHLYDKATAANGGVARPEARLYGMMAGAVIFPIGMWIFSWTQFGYVHWIAPIIALVPMVFGIYHIFVATYSYLTDAYGENGSSAVAGQGFIRNLMAASLPLFGGYMFKGMTYQGAGSFLAGLATLAAPFPFLLYKYGPTIREKSKFASTMDKKNKNQTEKKQQQKGRRSESTLDESSASEA